MASDVKWIKITTDIFDDEKILLIESLPDAYAIITVWFKLLCLAGKQNNSGVFLLGRMPYNEQMLATIFRMKESTVTMAIRTFEQFGMVEVIDGVITIPNWNKHQSLDAYEKKKERDRLYQAERRANQRMLVGKSSDTSSDKSSDIAVSDKDIDKEKDRDKDIIKDKPVRHKYGEYKNVLLSDEDMEKLKEEFPSDYEERIERLSSYIASSGKSYKNHLATIRNWARKDKKDAKASSFETDDVFNAAMRKSYSKLSPREALEREVAERMGAKSAVTIASDPELQRRAEELRKQFGT